MRNATASLIERDHALGVLRSALDAARVGDGGTVLISGEAGIGKTSLVARFAADHPELRVLWGGCEALFSPRPLGPLYDMVGALSDRVRALLGPQGHGVELFSALLAELQQSVEPTLLVFEDLHWADAATLDLLKYLARRLRRVRVLLVLTYRDDELGEQHPLRLLLGDVPADTVVRLPLPPLSETAVIELARRASRAPDGLHAATRGNPFFVTEALRGDGLPATVRDAVVARAARQPPPVRLLLDLVAIAPTRLEVCVADALVAPAPEVVSAALASGLLEADGSSYAYRHELARMAIEQALAPPTAAALHAKMLAHLESMGSSDAAGVALTRLVHHAARAGESSAVLTHAPQAAAEAASHGAHREAAALYATALAHSFSLSPVARAELLDAYAHQCYFTEQPDDAIAARQTALLTWRSLGKLEQEGRSLRWLSRLYWILDRTREANSCADEAVALLERLPAGTELAWALSNRSQLYLVLGQADAAVAWGNRALDLARRLGNTEVESHALNNMGAALWEAGEPSGEALLEQSLRLAVDHGHGEHIARGYANLAAAAVMTRAYPTARRVIDEATTYFSARDLDVTRKFALAYQCRLEFEQGRSTAAAELCERLLGQRVVAGFSRVPALLVLARLRLRSDGEGADQLLEEATALTLKSGELRRLAPLAAAHAEAVWLRRSVDPAAIDLLWRAFRLAQQVGSPRALGELTFWLRRLDLAHPEPVVVDAAYALQFSGDWRAAADTWKRLGCPHERAMALLEGDHAGMREALALFEALGAIATARRCRELLRDAGVRGIARGPRTTTAANPASLTTRELQILTLVAKGHTNAEIAARLFRSEKTVDHHVAAVLRKLSVRSRSEAASIATRLGLAD